LQKFLDRCTYFKFTEKGKAKAEAKKGYRLKDLTNLNLKIKIVLIFFNLSLRLYFSALGIIQVKN